MLLPRASDLEEEPTIDLNKVLEYARNITECPIYVGSLPKWTFLQCWQCVTPFFRLCTVKCVFVCIIAVQYNCYMLVCISMHFYYKKLLFMSIIESSISTLSMSVYAYNYTCLWFELTLLRSTGCANKLCIIIHHITLCCVLHQYANGCTL